MITLASARKLIFSFLFRQKIWVQTWLCNLCRSRECKLGRDNGDGTRSSGEQTRWGRQWKTQFELDWQRREKMRKIFGRRTILVCWRGRDREEKENWQLKTQFVQWRCCCSCGENMWNLKSQQKLFKCEQFWRRANITQLKSVLEIYLKFDEKCGGWNESLVPGCGPFICTEREHVAKIMICGIMMRRRMVLMIVVNCLLLREQAGYKSQLRNLSTI